MKPTHTADEWPIEIETRIHGLNQVNPSMYRVWGGSNPDGSFGAYYAILNPRLRRSGSRFAPTLGSESHIALETMLRFPPDRLMQLNWPGLD